MTSEAYAYTLRVKSWLLLAGSLVTVEFLLAQGVKSACYGLDFWQEQEIFVISTWFYSPTSQPSVR